MTIRRFHYYFLFSSHLILVLSWMLGVAPEMTEVSSFES